MLVQLTRHTFGIAFERIFLLISVRGDDAPLSDEAECQSATSRRAAPLQKWRLKRVVDYVNAHLSCRITLPDMATAAGLTRMHFAAQFRAATGMRPHDFILQRRIEWAQELLRNPELTLINVGLSVGFQNQAHFTTVFKRFAGDTPHRWRRLALERRSPQYAVLSLADLSSSGAEKHRNGNARLHHASADTACSNGDSTGS
jgi:AraC-like DNA-binding protein